MDKAFITDTKIDFNSRIITKPKYIQKNVSIELFDTVFVFNNGIKWIIISKKDMEKHPIIHDVYYDDVGTRLGEKSISDITISYCPFSGSCVIYFDKWFCNGSVYKNNIILSKGKLSVPQLSCTTCEGELIRREEVNVMTLRNALGRYPDCGYLNLGEKSNALEPIVKKNYSTSDEILYNKHNLSSYKYHPKSMVFGINYLSRDSNKNKYSVIIPIGTTKNETNNMDINKNGIDKYFIEMLDDIRERGGVIVPSYWFAWNEQFENSKVINLK